ncbi:MAG: acylneuraminate cytidylyltransferase family protein [Magnetococcales bacterium]|nr:acylneuraminate cytidylyltransferase family protein [Magnetococcales bacterium]
MVNGFSVLAIIPARGGSKGVPLKNIRHFRGKPLLAWTIESARNCQEIDRLILSSDHPEIMDVARHYGCEVPFVRPGAMATDQATSVEVALHALRTLPVRYDYFLWLQPTSPFRRVEDMRTALTLLIEGRNTSCVSVCRSHKPPEWMYRLHADHTMRPILAAAEAATNRQQIPPAYVINGAVYGCAVPWFMEVRKFVDDATKAFIMDERYSIDIDTELDFKLGELLPEG